MKMTRTTAGLGLLIVLFVFVAPTPSSALPCPVPSPLRLVQDDADSGRDAGDVPDLAVPVPGNGWQRGSLTAPVHDGLDDLHDWFYLDVGPGPHILTLDLQNEPNLVLGMGNTVPLIYYFELWREEGASPDLEFASWAPPQNVGADAERLLIHIYPSPLLWWDVCTSVGDWPAYLGLLPEPLQTYGFLVELAPTGP